MVSTRMRVPLIGALGAILLWVSDSTPLEAQATCDKIVALVRAGAPAAEVERTATAGRMSPGEQRACGQRLESDPAARRWLASQGSRRSSGPALTPKIGSGSRPPSRQRTVSPSFQAGQRAVTRLRQQLQRTPVPNQNIGRIRPPRGGSTTSGSAAAVNSVTPSVITSGSELIAQGVSLGSGGTALVRIEGREFPLAVQSWQDTWVHLFVPDSLGGIPVQRGAILVLQPTSGQPVQHSGLTFEPTQDSDVISAWMDVPAYLLPKQETIDLLSGELLTTHWKVSRLTLQDGGGRCRFSSPRADVGGRALHTVVLIDSGWFSPPTECTFQIYIEGPRGVLPHTIPGVGPNAMAPQP